MDYISPRSRGLKWLLLPTTTKEEVGGSTLVEEGYMRG